MEITELEKILGYTFKNKQILIEALTHPSKKVENRQIKSYQRLEFIGDKVLNFVIATELFHLFPNEQEGEISRRHANLVAGFVCNQIASDIGISQYVVFSRAQSNDITYRPEKVGEDVMEAIIGAIFIDGNIDKVQKFILQYWTNYIRKDLSPPKDSKSALQEYFQKHFKSLPTYEITHQGEGFIATIIINGEKFIAFARTKKEAEKKVADEIIQKYKI